MNDQIIGKTAGQVWEFLKEEGPAGVSLADIKKIPGVRADDAVAAVGWLAREGKLCFNSDRGKVVVALAEVEKVEASAR